MKFLNNSSKFIYKEKDKIELKELENLSLHLDLSSVLGIISNSYCIGDRTIFLEIKRRYNYRISDFKSFFSEYESLKQNRSDYINTFYKLFYEETFEILKKNKDIVIPLSGGLDSRIIAGMVRKIIDEQKLNNSVLCVNWGKNDSRDVIYAEKISKILKFDFIRLELTKEDYLKNIKECGDFCFLGVFPRHMHKLIDLKKVGKGKTIIAGSYGNSIGRGEFQGKHIGNNEFLSFSNNSRYMRYDSLLIAHSILHKEKKKLFKELDAKNKNSKFEAYKQFYYMRNYIDYVFKCIESKDLKVHQSFTSLKLLEFVWKSNSQNRNLKNYVSIIKMVNPDLLNVPDSSNNQIFGDKKNININTDIEYKFHNYDKWLNELINDKELIFSSDFLNFVNKFLKIDKILRNKKYDIQYCNLLSWLYSFNFLFKNLRDNKTDISIDINASYNIFNHYRAFEDKYYVNKIKRKIMNYRYSNFKKEIK